MASAWAVRGSLRLAPPRPLALATAAAPRHAQTLARAHARTYVSPMGRAHVNGGPSLAFVRFHSSSHALLLKEIEGGEESPETTPSIPQLSKERGEVTLAEELADSVSPAGTHTTVPQGLGSLADPRELRRQIEGIVGAPTCNMRAVTLALANCASASLQADHTQRLQLCEQIVCGLEQRGWELGLEHYTQLVAVCLFCGARERALHYLQTMKGSLPEDRTTVEHNKLVKVLVAEGGDAMELVGLMADNGVVPDTTTFNILLHAQAGSLKSVELVLKHMRESGVRRTVYTYHLALRACVDANDQVAAMRILGQMVQDSIPPTLHTFKMMMWGFTSRNNLEGAMEIVKVMGEVGIQPDMVALRRLMSLQLRCGEYEGAIATLNQMMENRMPAHTPHCNLILSHLLQRRINRQLIPKIAEYMRESGQDAWDISTYNLLLKYCAQTHNSEYAAQLFTEMQQKGGSVEPDHYTYATMLGVYVKSGEMSTAKTMLEFLFERADIPFNLFSFNALVHAAGHLGDAELCTRLVDSMKARRLQADVITYNGLMRAHLKANEPQKALDIFKNMLASGPAPTGSSAGLAGRAALLVDGPVAAASLLHSHNCYLPNAWQAVWLAMQTLDLQQSDVLRVYEQMNGTNMRPTVDTHHAVSRVILGCGLAGVVLRELPVWLEAGCTITKEELALFAQKCGQQGQVDAAVKVGHLLINHRSDDVKWVWPAIVHGFSKYPDAAVELGRVLNKTRIPLDGDAYAALVTACTTKGKYKAAFAWFQHAHHSGARVDGHMVSKVLEGLAGAGEWKHGLALLHTLCTEGFKPTAQQWGLCVIAAAGARQWGAVGSGLRGMWGCSMDLKGKQYAAIAKGMAEDGALVPLLGLNKKLKIRLQERFEGAAANRMLEPALRTLHAATCPQQNGGELPLQRVESDLQALAASAFPHGGTPHTPSRTPPQNEIPEFAGQPVESHQSAAETPKTKRKPKCQTNGASYLQHDHSDPAEVPEQPQPLRTKSEHEQGDRVLGDIVRMAGDVTPHTQRTRPRPDQEQSPQPQGPLQSSRDVNVTGQESENRQTPLWQEKVDNPAGKILDLLGVPPLNLSGSLQVGDSLGGKPGKSDNPLVETLENLPPALQIKYLRTELVGRIHGLEGEVRALRSENAQILQLLRHMTLKMDEMGKKKPLRDNRREGGDGEK